MKIVWNRLKITKKQTETNLSLVAISLLIIIVDYIFKVLRQVQLNNSTWEINKGSKVMIIENVLPS